MSDSLNEDEGVTEGRMTSGHAWTPPNQRR